MSKSKLDQLLKKREQLEAEIASAKRNERRKLQVADLAERAGILHFSDDELNAFFAQLSGDKQQKTAAPATENHPS